MKRRASVKGRGGFSIKGKRTPPPLRAADQDREEAALAKTPDLECGASDIRATCLSLRMSDHTGLKAQR